MSESQQIDNALAYLEWYFKEDEGKDQKTANAAWETVKDFVTRAAPFDVYDITYLPENGQLKPGRAAFYVRLNISATASAGIAKGNLHLHIQS